MTDEERRRVAYLACVDRRVDLAVSNYQGGGVRTASRNVAMLAVTKWIEALAKQADLSMRLLMSRLSLVSRFDRLGGVVATQAHTETFGFFIWPAASSGLCSSAILIVGLPIQPVAAAGWRLLTAAISDTAWSDQVRQTVFLSTTPMTGHS